MRLLSTLLLALIMHCSQADQTLFADEPGHIFWQAEYNRSDSINIPTEGSWTTVDMPHSWNIDKLLPTPENGVLWYRFLIPDDIIKRNGQGVFIDRSLSNIEVYLNTDYLGNGGSTERPVTRNWNTPLLFKIASSSWQTQQNYLYVRLIGEPPFGMLPPVLIGDYKVLKDRYYSPKHLVRMDLSRVSFALLILMCIFSLLLWQYTRQPLLLYAGLGCGMWIVALLYGFGREIPLSHPTFVRITHWCIDASSLSIVIFGHYKYNKASNALIRYALLYCACLAMVLMLLPNNAVVVTANLLHIITQCGIVYMLFYSGWQFYKTRSPSDFSFCLGLLVIISLFVHDVSLSLSRDLERWFYVPHLGHLSLPIMFLLMAYSLTNMYKHYLLTANTLNTELKQRLGEAKQQLQNQLEKRQKLDETQRINSERERVYSDLHDDLGAKLLSLVYASPDASKNDLARTALQDLRDVVSRVKQDHIPLDALLFDSIEEQRTRTQKLGLVFECTTNDIDSHLFYSATHALLFKRLIREYIGVLAHQFNSQRLCLNILVGYTGIEMSANTNTNNTHYDINSLQARALKLGGSVNINDNNTDTIQLVCWVPHPSPP